MSNQKTLENADAEGVGVNAVVICEFVESDLIDWMVSGIVAECESKGLTLMISKGRSKTGRLQKYNIVGTGKRAPSFRCKTSQEAIAKANNWLKKQSI